MRARANSLACRICGTGELGFMGRLGRLRWYACRQCGMQVSRAVGAPKPAPAKRRARVKWVKHRGKLYAKYGKRLTAKIWERTGPVDAPGAYRFEYVVFFGKSWVAQGNAGSLERAKRYAEEAFLEAARTHGKNPWTDVETIKMLRKALSKRGSIEVEKARLAEYAARTPVSFRKRVRRKLAMAKRNRHRRNPMDVATAWTGRKASYVSPRGTYGETGYSELAMHTRKAGKAVVRFALFTDKGRYPNVTWAQTEYLDGAVLDGGTHEVLPPEVLRVLGRGDYARPKLPGRKEKLQLWALSKGVEANRGRKTFKGRLRGRVTAIRNGPDGKKLLTLNAGGRVLSLRIPKRHYDRLKSDMGGVVVGKGLAVVKFAGKFKVVPAR